VDSRPEGEPALEPTAVIRRRPPSEPAAHTERRAIHTERIALVDLLDRVLAGGVVVSGEVTLSIADVDMVTVSLRALVTSVSTLARSGAEPEVPGR
jgi:predicted TIM-barrel enzyme